MSRRFMVEDDFDFNKVRDRESLVVSSTLVLSRAGGEGSRDIHYWRKSILR